ncbi:protoglobin domain-containing protein [Candidatus Pyrohabitans sp.]
METIEEHKVYYNWGAEDEENLRKLGDFGKKYSAEFVQELHYYLATFKDVEKYIPDEKALERHGEKLKYWFEILFSGEYDAKYIKSIYRIGEVHLKIGLPPHYMTATMNFIRRFILEKLTLELGSSENRDRVMSSVEKLLDLNLDVMISSYREEELKLYLALGKYQRILIEGIRRISYGFDIFIVVALLISGLFLVSWIVYEMFMIINGEMALEKGVLSLMGTVLILYAVSELLDGEIKRLKGGLLSLKVFVSVALAAVIRKVLILSLSPEKIIEILAISGLLLSLAVVYWAIYKVEARV